MSSGTQFLAHEREQTMFGGQDERMFVNPFHIDDVRVFDDAAWSNILAHETGRTIKLLGCAVRAASSEIIEQIARNLPASRRNQFWQAFVQAVSPVEIAGAQGWVLDRLFWELIYWRLPDDYELLTKGEKLHPGIFSRLAPDVRGKVVLDAGAGSGRATFASLQMGAESVYAIEPSPGLRQILQRKLRDRGVERQVVVSYGRFDALPLPDESVDISLACSAFSALPERGGEPGLREMLRVTRPGGKILILWPGMNDLAWFQQHGFHYECLPIEREMGICFSTLSDALHCARLFYGRKPEVENYILSTQQPEILFSLIGMHPPCDYCWLEIPDKQCRSGKSIG